MDAERVSAPQCTSRMHGAELERPVSSSQELAQAARSGEVMAAIVLIVSYTLRNLLLELLASCLKESHS